MENKHTKNIGIISFSIHSHPYNYGAALHSFAFYKYLKTITKCNVYIINYYSKQVESKSFYKKYIKGLLTCNIYRTIFNYKNTKNYLTKRKYFIDFFNKNCKITTKEYSEKNLSDLRNIDQYICETDVTWTTHKGRYDRGFMCDFPNMKGKPNIAYSIDFGTADIISKEQLINYAKNFKNISIRNIFKLEYIKNLLNRNDICVTIDPVFLVDKKEYDNLIPNDCKYKNYVLLYHCQEYNDKMVKSAKEFAKSKNLELITINSFSSMTKSILNDNPTPYKIEEFLNLIKNANYIYTNSYHGICFAIIFQREFLAFTRDGNNEKILTILTLSGLTNHLYANNPLIENTNWEMVINRLNPIINYSKEVLKSSIIQID